MDIESCKGPMKTRERKKEEKNLTLSGQVG